MSSLTTHGGPASTFRSFLESLPLPSSFRNSPLIGKSTRRTSVGRHGTPGSSLAKGNAYETGRFDDLVDDEEGIGLVDGDDSASDDLKGGGTVLRRKSVFGEEDSNVRRVELRIGGMTVSDLYELPYQRTIPNEICSWCHQCGACVASIESLSKTQPGIVSVQVSLLAERGIVEYDETVEDPAWTPEKIAEEIEDCGFEAQVVEKSLVTDVQMSVFGLVLWFKEFVKRGG